MMIVKRTRVMIIGRTKFKFLRIMNNWNYLISVVFVFSTLASSANVPAFMQSSVVKMTVYVCSEFRIHDLRSHRCVGVRLFLG